MALQLYYDNFKGLVKSNDYAIGQSITEHDDRGWKTPLHLQTLEIPSRNVKIVVKTNLHYGVRSYMKATISLMDKSVLNFLDTNMCHSVNMVYADPGDWNMLFDGIINLYNNIYNSENSVNSYFDVIEETINASKAVNTMSDAVARLAEVAEGLPDSIYCDSTIIDKRMKSACRLMVQHIMENWGNVLLTEEKHQTIETDLHSIFKYLADRKELLNVLANTSQRLASEA